MDRMPQSAAATLEAFPALAHVPVPVACPSLPMYLIWHVRYQQDAAHRWLRAQLQEVLAEVLPPGSGAPASASVALP